jgi:MSHA biogenesis protein MshO
MATQRNQRGTTLIELITVISILGVIASVASVFIRGPIDAYVDSARRAALTDSADTAMRRIARDARKALPNSTRIVPNPNPLSLTTNCLEFIPTKTAGRYRAAPSVPSGGNILDFVTAVGDASLNMLGLNSDLPADQQIKNLDWIAVYNLGVSGANAYTGDNISLVVASVVDDTCLEGDIDCEAAITIGSKLFPQASGSKRFYVIPKEENIVSYVCDDSGNLRRTARDFNPADPSAGYCPAGGPILASNVATCEFSDGFTDLQPNDLQRNEPVRLTITFTDDSGESISLYHQVSENNWP